MRLQKYLSAAGVCSRREAEERIAAGRVTVNGKVASLGDGTDSPEDVVRMDGVIVRPVEVHTYVLLNKPRGYVTTLHDEKGRPTVAELVRDAGVRLYPVGRLDCMSEGLLLMTDDGETANFLAHPSCGVKKTYRVWVKGEGESIAPYAEKLTHSITYKGVKYRGAQVRIAKDNEKESVLELTIAEGKNREIRNMCAALSLRVLRLQRIRQGELSLGGLAPGEWRYLTEKEAAYLRELHS